MIWIHIGKSIAVGLDRRPICFFDPPDFRLVPIEQTAARLAAFPHGLADRHGTLVMKVVKKCNDAFEAVGGQGHLLGRDESGLAMQPVMPRVPGESPSNIPQRPGSYVFGLLL